MTYMATITSRGQVTLPANLFRNTKLRRGEKVVFTVINNEVKIESALELVNSLAGSIKVPDSLKGRDVDELIKEARAARYKNKTG